MKDKATRDAYTVLEDEFSIAHEPIAARLQAGLTQIKVAERMSTKQSVIARMESGRTLASLRTLSRYAQAIGFAATVKLTRDRQDRKAAD